MKKLPVKFDLEWSKIHSWRNVNPYTICFVYPEKGEAFIAKGGLSDIEKVIKSVMEDQNYVYRYEIFGHGASRGSWKIKLPKEYNAYLFEKGKKNPARMMVFKNGEKIIEKNLKRIPRCFPNEFRNLK